MHICYFYFKIMEANSLLYLLFFFLFLHHTDSLQTSVHIKRIIPTTAVYITISSIALVLIKTTQLSCFFTCPYSVIHLDELSTASIIIFSDLVRLLLKK